MPVHRVTPPTVDQLEAVVGDVERRGDRVIALNTPRYGEWFVVSAGSEPQRIIER